MDPIENPYESPHSDDSASPCSFPFKVSGELKAEDLVGCKFQLSEKILQEHRKNFTVRFTDRWIEFDNGMEKTRTSWFYISQFLEDQGMIWIGTYTHPSTYFFSMSWVPAHLRASLIAKIKLTIENRAEVPSLTESDQYPLTNPITLFDRAEKEDLKSSKEESEAWKKYTQYQYQSPMFFKYQSGDWLRFLIVCVVTAVFFLVRHASLTIDESYEGYIFPSLALLIIALWFNRKFVGRVLLYVLMLILMVLFSPRILLQVYRLRKERDFYYPHTLKISDEGYVISNPAQSTFWDWSGFLGYSQTDDFLCIGAIGQPLGILKSLLKDQSHWQKVISLCERNLEKFEFEELQFRSTEYLVKPPEPDAQDNAKKD